MTPLTLALVALASTLIRSPYMEFVTVLLLIVTPLTVLLEAMEPMEIPCPPEQVFLVKVMDDPELIARQSSWFFTTEFWMVTSEAES